MTLATIQDQRPHRQGQLVLAPAHTEPNGQPGERSRPPLDADATCHAVTRPITPAVPNRAITAAVAAPTAASTSRHGDPSVACQRDGTTVLPWPGWSHQRGRRHPSAFGTAWSTPASRATTLKCTRTAANRAAHRRNQPRTVPAGTPSHTAIRR